MDITSTERVPPAADVSSTVEGSGYTIAPYFVRQTESGAYTTYLLGSVPTTWIRRAAPQPHHSSPKDNSLAQDTAQPKPSPTRCLYSTNLPQVTLGTTSPATPRRRHNGSEVRDQAHSDDGEARFTQDMDGIAPFLGVSLIWNSFSASGGSGPAPREYDYTPLLSVGFNFSNDILYGMVAMQGERDKKTTQFYIGFRF